MSFFSCRTAACLAKGARPSFSYMLIATSKTSDPRDGFFGPYFVATDGINPDTNEVASRAGAVLRRRVSKLCVTEPVRAALPRVWRLRCRALRVHGQGLSGGLPQSCPRQTRLLVRTIPSFPAAFDLF